MVTKRDLEVAIAAYGLGRILPQGSTTAAARSVVSQIVRGGKVIDRTVVLLRFLHISLTFLLLLSRHIQQWEWSVHLFLIGFIQRTFLPFCSLKVELSDVDAFLFLVVDLQDVVFVLDFGY